MTFDPTVERLTGYSGDVVALMRDLVDLGDVRRLPDEGGPNRFALAD